METKATLPTPPVPTTPTETVASNAAPQRAPETHATPAPEAWQEFLEDDADCCGGCHHKPR